MPNTPVMDILTAYKEGNNFERLISDKYVWITPIYNENMEVVSKAAFNKGVTEDEIKKLNLKFKDEWTKDRFMEKIKENSGKWKLVRIGNTIAVKDLEFVSDPDQVSNFLIENGLEGASNIKYVTLGPYHTDILYIKYNNEEYAVPFGLRPDLTHLENRRIYKISEVLETLDKVFNNNLIKEQ